MQALSQLSYSPKRGLQPKLREGNHTRMRRLRQTNGLRFVFRGFDVSAAPSHDPRPRTAAARRDQEPCSDQTLPGRVTIRPLGVGCSGPKAKACPQAVRQPPAPRWAQGLSWGHQMGIRRGHPNGIPLLLEGLQVDRQEASCCLGWCADSWALWDLWAPHHRDFRNGLGWCGNNQVLAEGVSPSADAD